MTLTLYHAYPSRSAIVHWMLEELGEPFELKRLDLAQGEHKRPEFLKINPLGKVPTLVHDGQVLTGTGAICAYLADTFPQAGLAPPPGDPARGVYYRWLFFTGAELEPAMLESSFKLDLEGKRGQIGWPPLPAALDLIEAALEPGPYLLGERFSAADIVLGSTLAWGMMFGVIEARPRFQAYVAQADRRPAWHRAQARDGANGQPAS